MNCGADLPIVLDQALAKFNQQCGRSFHPDSFNFGIDDLEDTNPSWKELSWGDFPEVINIVMSPKDDTMSLNVIQSERLILQESQSTQKETVKDASICSGCIRLEGVVADLRKEMATMKANHATMEANYATMEANHQKDKKEMNQVMANLTKEWNQMSIEIIREQNRLKSIRLRKLIYHGRAKCVRDVDGTKDERDFFQMYHSGQLTIPPNLQNLLLSGHEQGNRFAHETNSGDELYNLACTVCSLKQSERAEYTAIFEACFGKSPDDVMSEEVI